MAWPESVALTPLARAQLGELGAVLPAPTARLVIGIVEPMHVLSLRHLPGGNTAIAGALAAQGLHALPEARRFAGDDPCVLWRSPSEWLLLTAGAAVAAGIASALRPAPGALAVAVDLTAGSLVLDLRGADVDALLSRLVDATAVPTAVGEGTRARLADIAVALLRVESDRVRLVADRANDRYLAQWLAYAARALDAT
jgi:heterotetrameric sarcosine oxidase gamma subunit